MQVLDTQTISRYVCNMSKAKSTCSVEGCPNTSRARGMCPKHYTRWKRYGDPLAGRPTDPWDRLMLRVVKTPSGCWLSNKGTNYGSVFVDGKHVYAHVFTWTRLNGPVPDGKELDHFVCDTRPCCNPEHVKPVTHRENILRSNAVCGINFRKTHCKRNHEFTPDNIVWLKTKGYSDRRECKTCRILMKANQLEYQLAGVAPTYLPL